jgi:ornithine carbamoyltransferase
MLVIRANSHEKLLYLAEELEIPLINARTDYNHLCEIMGDLQFIRRYRKSLENLNVVFVGEVSNLCMSWFEAAARLPIKVTQIAPPGYEAGKELLSKLKEKAIGSIHVSNELDSSIEKADVIYTDCWPSADQQEAAEIIRKRFLPYQITGELLSVLNEKAIFLPCPPVTRGQEVSSDAMNSKLCMNYKAKEYLLHSQNAIIEKLMES